MRRLPAGVWQAKVIVMGQEAKAFERAGLVGVRIGRRPTAPPARRRWFDSHEGTMAVLRAPRTSTT